ncbi:MAG: M48 family metallopeptidase [Pirellulaceae bacterium]
MGFFEHQAQAHRNSKRLTVLFAVAVLSVVLSVSLLFSFVVAIRAVMKPDEPRKPITFVAVLTNWPIPITFVAVLTNWPILLISGGGTLLIIGGACALRISQLKGGGHVVATSVGGRHLTQDVSRKNLAERRLLNVVEEMAIASGTPVPPVYVLEEEGINAFAAGHSPQDAVIGVTRGCIQALSRDELQGVIAHEFSHILNGDMRVNIRMVGFLYGIMAIGQIGWQLLRIAFYSGGSRRSDNDKNSGAGMSVAIGAGLIVVGAVGTLFGKWIKASLSRQREFLADASAVQFTRNPGGISGALKCIAASSEKGKIESSAASEFSHMYFASSIASKWSGLFATHPSLDKRLLRIEPQWDGKYTRSPGNQGNRKASATPKKKVAESSRQRAGKAGAILAGMAAIGRPSPAHLLQAQKLIGEIPDSLKEAARSPFGARAVLYALLLNQEQEPREKQLAQLKQSAEAGLAELTESIFSEMSNLEPQHRLPLVEMTLGALKELSTTQHKHFMTNLNVLIRADDKIELFEWVVVRVVHHHLDLSRRSRPKKSSLKRLTASCHNLLSNLAWAGHEDPDEVLKAFNIGAKEIGISGLALTPQYRLNLSKLGVALDKLNGVNLSEKKILLQACAQCILADQTVTVSEAELLRAIAESFECPMPPVVPGQEVEGVVEEDSTSPVS